jgi:predicted HTH domain antitoxin
MKITVNLPENLGLREFDFVVYFASKLYEDGLLSSGQAADMAGLSKKSFIEILGKYNVSLFSQSEDDLLNDIKNA